MNIFVLDYDPLQAARLQCNKHVVKMIVESAQLLCNAVGGPYKPTHVNHPCSRWTRESPGNYQWLHAHALELCAEYTRRYARTHKTLAVIHSLPLQRGELTPFARAIPRELDHITDVVEAYREYYKTKSFAGPHEYRLHAYDASGTEGMYRLICSDCVSHPAAHRVAHPWAGTIRPCAACGRHFTLSR